MRRALSAALALSILSVATVALAQPVPELSESSIDFGTLPYSGWATESFFVRNTGDVNLIVQSVTVDDINHYSVPGGAFQVAPGDSYKVDVTFTPLALGTYPATVSVMNFNATPETLQVQVTGQGGANTPNLQISADSVVVELLDGFDGQDTIQISNTGGGSLDWEIDEALNWCWALPWIQSNTFGVSRDVVVYFDASYGPGFYEGYLIVLSNDPDTPVDSIYVAMYVDEAPDISVFPTSIDYGETWLGFSHQEEFIIYSVGQGILDISDIQSSNPEFTVDHTTASLFPNEEDTVTVTFTPTSAGFRNTQVTIYSDDPDESEVVVYLQSFVDSGDPPEISVNTDTISVSVFTGEMDSAVVNVGNIGPDTLDWTLTFDGTEPDPLDGLRILVDQSHDPVGGFGNNTMFMSAMEALGAEFTLAAVLNEPMLYYHDILIVPDQQQGWLPSEIDMVTEWLSGGGTILTNARLWPQRGSMNDIYDDVSSGLTHATRSEPGNSEYLTNLNAHPVTNGASQLFVSQNDYRVYGGTWLARFQDNAIHSALDDVGGRAVAMAQPLWENAQLSQPNQDNLLVMRQVMEWLARSTAWLGADVIGGVVLPGGDQDVTVYFDASYLAGGSRSAELVFASNDPANPEVRVPVVINVTGIQTITVSDSTLDMGSRYIGQQRQETIWITNSGTGILDISGITLPDTNFTLGPYASVLEPGDTTFLDVTFAPVEEKVFDLPLMIVSDATNADTLSIPVVAAGLDELAFMFDPDSVAAYVQPGDSLLVDVDVTNTGIKVEPVEFFVFDGPPGTIPLMFDNFEDLDYAMWASAGGPGTWTVTGDVNAAQGSIYYLQLTNSQLGHLDGRYATLPAVQATSLSFWINPMQTNKAANYVRAQDGLGRDVIFFLAEGTGNFYINGNVGGHTSYAYNADTWYHVECRDIDWTAKTFDYYVDDVLVQADVPMRNAADVTEISRIDLYNYASDAGARWDNIRVVWGGAPSWLDASPQPTSLPADTPVELTLDLDGTTLPIGVYDATIVLLGNAPETEIATLPVRFTVDPASDAGDTPDVFANALRQNVPNPFNPVTTITYELANPGRVDVVVYSVRGERVRTLVSGDRPSGRYTVTWDGHNDRGERVASGVYFYRMITGRFAQTRKMVLLK